MTLINVSMPFKRARVLRGLGSEYAKCALVAGVSMPFKRARVLRGL